MLATGSDGYHYNGLQGDGYKVTAQTEKGQTVIGIKVAVKLRAYNELYMTLSLIFNSTYISGNINDLQYNDFN